MKKLKVVKEVRFTRNVGTVSLNDAIESVLGITGTEQAKIMASDIEAGDSFGYSVSISSDGNTAIVGANFEDTGGSSAGAAYIFI